MNEEIKEEWNIAYKAFRKAYPDMKVGSTSANGINNEITLSFSYPLSIFNHGGLKIEYQYNKIITPKIGKIFGFKSIYDLKSFIITYFQYTIYFEIWKISAKFSQLPPYMAPSNYDCQQLRYWWKEFEKTGKKPKNSLITPKGTILCDAVKLIEKVE